MTKSDLVAFLAQYPDDTVIQIWPFQGVRSATSVEEGHFIRSETVDGHVFPTTLSIKPVVEP